MHYAVPRILNDAGALERLYTDLFIGQTIVSILDLLPIFSRVTSIKRIKGRYADGLQGERVVAFNRLGFQYAYKLRQARNEEARMAAYNWAADMFASKIREAGWGNANCIYGFNGASGQVFADAKAKGIRTVLEQTIAPKKIEADIIGNAAKRMGEMGARISAEAREYMTREEEEWRLADQIVCASEFVREGLVQCGVAKEKCFVVPYGVELSVFRGYGQRHIRDRQTQRDGKQIRVLFVGGIGTRKGIWDLLEAMRLIGSTSITCRVIGPFMATPVAVQRQCPENVEIVGPVARAQIPHEMRGADIFCLPSLCEGSATVIYEALAAGLPVITTENAGSIVRHGKEGVIVAPGDPNGLADAVELLASDVNLRNEMARNAMLRSEYGSMEQYGHRLRRVLGIGSETQA